MKIIPIIITYHFRDDFEPRVRGLLANFPQLVIVDNASGETCKQILYRLAAQFSGLRLIENTENLGIAAALNQGVRAALELGAQWVLTLDQDSEVSTNMVQTMLNAYQALPEDEQRRCVSLFPEYRDRNLLAGKVETSDPDNTESSPLTVEITSGNLLRNDVFQTVGFFDEKLFIDYVDHDFCLRINLAGLSSRQCHGAVLMHQLGDYRPTSFCGFRFYTTNSSVLRAYYRTRNRFYVCKQYRRDFPQFCRHDRKTFWVSCIKILLGEKQPLQKLLFSWKGYRDYRCNRYGKYQK